MKYSLIFIIGALLSFSACSKNGSVDDLRYVKDIDFPVNPIDHIHRSMIVCHFGVSSSKLHYVEEAISDNNSLSVCGFEWEKIDHDEIQEYRTNIMTAYAMNSTSREYGLSKIVGFSDLKQLESPFNHLKIGLFKQYASFKSAKRAFNNSHQNSSQKEMQELNENADGQSEILNLQTTDSGEGQKFTVIEGVGNQAYYNHKMKSLDVLFGNISFSVFIDSEFDTETDILIAKKIAYEVWKSL